jgi:hypothetical protein
MGGMMGGWQMVAMYAKGDDSSQWLRTATVMVATGGIG